MPVVPTAHHRNDSLANSLTPVSPTRKDLLHTYDKFVGPIPEDLDAGTKALHSLLPRLFDSKVVMTKAIAEGMRFPRTVLGEAHQWLRANFPAPPPSPLQTASGEAEAEAEAATARATEQPAGTEAATNAGAGEKANGDSATNRERDACLVGITVDGAEEISEGEASAAVAAVATATAERTRKAWDAVFAPGFEERYKDGGQEHEVCFLAAGGTRVSQPGKPSRSICTCVHIHQLNTGCSSFCCVWRS